LASLPESFLSPIGFPAWEVFLPTTAQALAHGEWWQTLVWSVGRLKRGCRRRKPRRSWPRSGRPTAFRPRSWRASCRGSCRYARLYRSDRDRGDRRPVWSRGFLYAMACATRSISSSCARFGRRLELGVRVALGGCRQRLFQLLVIESLLMIGAAGLAAGLLAWRFCSLLVGSVHFLVANRGPHQCQVRHVVGCWWAWRRSARSSSSESCPPAARCGRQPGNHREAKPAGWATTASFRPVARGLGRRAGGAGRDLAGGSLRFAAKLGRTW